ncbi:MAG: stage II sporulation protein M [Myxococcales bacterium]|nr:stage II sporulation protein M [Myxococcales bacterium]
MVERAEKRGPRRLSAEDLSRLPALHRATVSSLSVARAITLDRGLIAYLDNLCVRAHLLVYGPSVGLIKSTRRFMSQRFPETVRRYAKAVAVAWACMIIGTLAGLALTRSDPEMFYVFVGKNLAGGRGPMSTRDELRNVLYGIHKSPDALAYLTSELFTHNTRVGFTAFAFGMLFGLPVFLALIYNGLILGAFWAIHLDQGLGLDLWLWLLPHGVTELLAISLCGAAGLILGHALLFPGQRPRMQNLGIEGRNAAVLVIGTIPMFLLAGLIEGVLRQLVNDVAVRGAVSLLTALLWGWYFARMGRETR